MKSLFGNTFSKTLKHPSRINQGVYINQIVELNMTLTMFPLK